LNTCADCGKPTRHRQCRPCYLAAARSPDRAGRTCADCGGPVSRDARLCRKCFTATQGDEWGQSMPMGGHEAVKYGAIVTLENSEGQRLVLHRHGRVRAAVIDAATVARRLDPTFGIICVSTPNSIYADMQGARVHVHQGFAGLAQLPELARVPAALLHPSLRLGPGATLEPRR